MAESRENKYIKDNKRDLLKAPPPGNYDINYEMTKPAVRKHEFVNKRYSTKTYKRRPFLDLTPQFKGLYEKKFVLPDFGKMVARYFILKKTNFRENPNKVDSADKPYSEYKSGQQNSDQGGLGGTRAKIQSREAYLLPSWDLHK